MDAVTDHNVRETGDHRSGLTSLPKAAFLPAGSAANEVADNPWSPTTR